MAGRWTAESDRDYDAENDRWREIVGCANCGTDTPRYEGVSRAQALCDACWAKAVTTQIQKAERGVA